MKKDVYIGGSQSAPTVARSGGIVSAASRSDMCLLLLLVGKHESEKRGVDCMFRCRGAVSAHQRLTDGAAGNHHEW